jgi:hypothetical protein
MFTDREVQKKLAPLLKKELKAFGYEETIARSATDSNGEDILRVYAVTRKAGQIDGKTYSAVITAVNGTLAGLGESRFALVSFGLPPDRITGPVVY